jgi:hypothetical protein
LRVSFLCVRDAYGLDDLVGQVILYEELYVHDDGRFEFSALCNQSEFSLSFVDVLISSPGPKRTREGRTVHRGKNGTSSARDGCAGREPRAQSQPPCHDRPETPS